MRNMIQHLYLNYAVFALKTSVEAQAFRKSIKSNLKGLKSDHFVLELTQLYVRCSIEEHSRKISGLIEPHVAHLLFGIESEKNLL